MAEQPTSVAESANDGASADDKASADGATSEERTKSERERAHDENVDADERPFLAHLLELRQRLVRSLLVVFVGFFPVFAFIDPIFDFVTGPMRAALPGTMIATQVASPFLTPLKLAIYVTIFASVPVLLHQAWGFVSPGLYLREKRFAIPLLVSSTTLFYLGMAFAYFAVFPLVFQFFASVTPTGVEMATDINHYLDFVLKMFFAFGIAFEIPVATVLLSLTGLATPPGHGPQTPLRHRRLLRGRNAAHPPGRDQPDPARPARLAPVRNRHPAGTNAWKEERGHDIRVSVPGEPVLRTLLDSESD